MLFFFFQLNHLIGNERTFQKRVDVIMPDMAEQSRDEKGSKAERVKQRHNYIKSREISKAMFVCVKSEGFRS